MMRSSSLDRFTKLLKSGRCLRCQILTTLRTSTLRTLLIKAISFHHSKLRRLSYLQITPLSIWDRITINRFRVTSKTNTNLC